MKTLLLIAILVAGVWFFYGWLQKQPTIAKVQQNAVQYTQNLKDDVQKADQARDKANAVIQKEVDLAKQAAQATHSN